MPTPMLDLEAASITVQEGDTATIRVRLSAQPTGTVTVTASETDADISLSPASRSFTTSNWNTYQAFTVSGLQDADTVNDTATVSLSASGGGVSDTQDVSVTINDTTASLPTMPLLDVKSTTIGVAEGGTATIQVRLSAQPTGTVTVTATENHDDISLSPASRQFTTANWNQYQNFTVTGLQDEDTKGETPTVTLTGSGSGVTDTESVVVTISDDDTPTPVQGTHYVYATVTLPRRLNPTFTWSNATADLSSTDRVRQGDIASSMRPELVTIFEQALALWEAVCDVSFSEEDDAAGNDLRVGMYDPGNSYVYAVEASYHSAGSTVQKNSAITFSSVRFGSTTDDFLQTAIHEIGHFLGLGHCAATDQIMNPYIDNFRSYSSPQYGDVRGAAGFWNADGGFSIRIPQCFEVEPFVYEGAGKKHHFNYLTWEGVRGAGAYQDRWKQTGQSEWGAWVSRNGTSNSELRGTSNGLVSGTSYDHQVRALDGDGNASGASSTQTHVFASSPSSPTSPPPLPTSVLAAPQNLRTSGNPGTDNIVLEWDETGAPKYQHRYRVSGGTWSLWEYQMGVNTCEVIAGLSAGTTYEFQVRAAAGGSIYGTASDTHTETTAGSSSPTLDVADTTVTVREGGTASIRVRLSAQPTGTVTVSASEADADISLSPSSRSFSTSNWNTYQSFTVSGLQDADTENDTATVSLSASGGGVTDSKTVSVTITDDDAAPTLDVEATAITVQEGGTASIRVRLSGQPTGTVTVSASETDADISLSPSSRSFTTSNWNTYQSFTVSGLQDADTANDSATVSLSASGGGVTDSKTVSVTITDDDAAPTLDVEATTVTVQEGGTASIRVRLSGQPTGTVTVSASETDADISLSPASRSFTTSNWNTYQSFTVSGLQDADTANDTATVSLSASGGGGDGLGNGQRHHCR